MSNILPNYCRANCQTVLFYCIVWFQQMWRHEKIASNKHVAVTNFLSLILWSFRQINAHAVVYLKKFHRMEQLIFADWLQIADPTISFPYNLSIILHKFCPLFKGDYVFKLKLPRYNNVYWWSAAVVFYSPQVHIVRVDELTEVKIKF